MKSLKRLFKNERGFSQHLLLPVVVIAAVAAIGGYVLVKSHASPALPPPQYNAVKNYNAYISDTKNFGTVTCPFYRFSSSLGVGVYCAQIRSNGTQYGQARFGIVNTAAFTFLPQTSWMNVVAPNPSLDGVTTYSLCPNGLYFQTITSLSTPYGNTDYGVFMRPSSGSWQVESAILNWQYYLHNKPNSCSAISGSTWFSTTNKY